MWIIHSTTIDIHAEEKEKMNFSEGWAGNSPETTRSIIPQGYLSIHLTIV